MKSPAEKYFYSFGKRRLRNKHAVFKEGKRKNRRQNTPLCTVREDVAHLRYQRTGLSRCRGKCDLCIYWKRMQKLPSCSVRRLLDGRDGKTCAPFSRQVQCLRGQFDHPDGKEIVLMTAIAIVAIWAAKTGRTGWKDCACLDSFDLFSSELDALQIA